jgi:DNA-binding ferritin-like protein (Dps family)
MANKCHIDWSTGLARAKDEEVQQLQRQIKQLQTDYQEKVRQVRNYEVFISYTTSDNGSMD